MSETNYEQGTSNIYPATLLSSERITPETTAEVRLFYGTRTGTDMPYMNDQNNDLGNDYDQATFQAVQSVGRGLLSDEGDALKQGVEAHAAEIWTLIQDPKTHVYLAGMDKVVPVFEETMVSAVGSMETWQAAKQHLMDERRRSQLTYQ